MKPSRTGLVLLIVALVGLLAVGGFYVFGLTQEPGTLTLATTTSTEDSGLLEELLPPFEEASNCTVVVVAVGTGQALALGRNGDADVLLVHAPASEKAFMDEGHGLERRPVMYNDFVVLGPPDDPAGLGAAATLEEALTALAVAGAEGNALFLSRGDDSGTHKKELGLWTRYAIDATGAWYESIGSGMGDTLRMAADRSAYTLSDRATYLALYGPGAEGEGRLAIVSQGDPDLFNPYHVIIIDPAAHPNVNVDLATAFADYLISDQARQIINTFGVDQYGEQLFQVLVEEN